MQVNLQTNGVLLTEKTWKRLRKIHGKIGAVLVSLDAATADTYAVTRRGGDWDRLRQDMEFLARLRRNGEIEMLALYLIVQHANFREMPGMVVLGKRFGADHVNFSKVAWWGNWTFTEMLHPRV